METLTENEQIVVNGFSDIENLQYLFESIPVSNSNGVVKSLCGQKKYKDLSYSLKSSRILMHNIDEQTSITISDIDKDRTIQKSSVESSIFRNLNVILYDGLSKLPNTKKFIFQKGKKYFFENSKNLLFKKIEDLLKSNSWIIIPPCLENTMKKSQNFLKTKYYRMNKKTIYEIGTLKNKKVFLNPSCGEKIIFFGNDNSITFIFNKFPKILDKKIYDGDFTKKISIEFEYLMIENHPISSLLID